MSQEPGVCMVHLTSSQLEIESKRLEAKQAELYMICSVMKAHQLSSGMIFLELKMNNVSGRSLPFSTTAC